MPLNDVRKVKKIQLCKDSVPSHRIKATQNFLTQHARYVSSQERKPHLTDLNLLH